MRLALFGSLCSLPSPLLPYRAYAQHAASGRQASAACFEGDQEGQAYQWSRIWVGPPTQTWEFPATHFPLPWECRHEAGSSDVIFDMGQSLTLGRLRLRG